jgi:uncharacterized membrane protein YeaQ/YmgE (transglycosylase-associated protein family)
MNLGQIVVWIIVGGFAGTLAGRAITLKKEGLGRWTNLLIGMAGAVIGGRRSLNDRIHENEHVYS